MAEQLYHAIQQWSSLNSLTICETSFPFWKDLYPAAETGIYTKSRKVFQKLLDAMFIYADGFVKIALKYTPNDGGLAKQFSRENGTALSARDLTWSYASFITMGSAGLGATWQAPWVAS